jgi:anti-sigma regulatory factor (Ser/Thr protein kinase)
MPSQSFPPAACSIGLARQFVRRELEAAGVDWHDAVAMTSAIAENAVVHANTDFVVEVHVTDERVRVDVVDHRRAVPELSTVIAFPNRGAVGGPPAHGLELLRKLAWARGWSSREHGKSVWFEIKRAELAS